MKRITIHLETSVITIDDQDEENLDDYTNKLTRLCCQEQILILHTTSGNVILRPSEIKALYVQEIETVNTEIKEIEESIEKTTQDEIDQDIITD